MSPYLRRTTLFYSNPCKGKNIRTKKITCDILLSRKQTLLPASTSYGEHWIFCGNFKNIVPYPFAGFKCRLGDSRPSARFADYVHVFVVVGILTGFAIAIILKNRKVHNTLFLIRSFIRFFKNIDLSIFFKKCDVSKKRWFEHFF